MTDAQSEWARCKPWIEAGLPSDLYDISDIEDGIASGQMQFWPGRRCAAVTEFVTYPNCKVLNVLSVGGVKGKALRELARELEPQLVRWAAASDCKHIMGFGVSESWKSVCEGMGYAFQWLVMIKKVEA